MSSGISTDRRGGRQPGERAAGAPQPGERAVGAPQTGAPYVRADVGPAGLRPASDVRDNGFQPWHFFLLTAMAAATFAVARTEHTHPAALLLLSAAVVAAGLAGFAAYRALGAFLGFGGHDAAPLTTSARDGLLREKALTLRSIKELEFDHAMGKISDADFQDMDSRLRGRALVLMEELQRAPVGETRSPAPRSRPAPASVRACGECGTEYDADARFCKRCGKAVA